MSLTFSSDNSYHVKGGCLAVVFGTEWIAAVYTTFPSDTSVLVPHGCVAAIFGTEWIVTSFSFRRHIIYVRA